MSGRKLLADALKTALPAWQIVSDARTLDGVRKPGAAVLWTARRLRPDKVTLDLLTDEITLWVLTATDRPADIEDDLDQLLDLAIEVLESLDWCVWAEATRGVLAETWHGWQLTVTCNYRITT